MLRSMRSLYRYTNKIFKRQLSAEQRYVKGDKKFAWKLLCLGGISSGFYLAIGIQNGYATGKKKKVVVLGSGWAAVNFIRNLKPELYELSIVSASNYFLFTPLLPSVTVGTVEVRSVVEPIRNLIHKKHKNTVSFYEGECIDVDIDNQKIRCKDNSAVLGSKSEYTLDYDILIVGIGSDNATFNIPGVREHCHFLKSVEDACKLRNTVMDCFETAAIPGQPQSEIERLLHFVVVGAGPTGVEFAAELRDLVREDLKHLYPHLIEYCKVTLVEALPQILNAYDENIKEYTTNHFKKDGINIWTKHMVTKVERNCVTVKKMETNEVINVPFGTCVWSTGIAPQELTKKIMKKIPGQTNRHALLTDYHLQVKNSNGHIYAMGDCCTIEQRKLLSDVKEIFTDADKDGDGKLNLEEFKAAIEQARNKYPQICKHFSGEDWDDSLQNAFKEADENADGCLGIAEFEKLLKTVDNKLTNLPCTAQVASQKGKYLGKLFSQHSDIIGEQSNLSERGVEQFEYNHMGMFAYIGDDKAVLQFPIIGSFKGLGAMYLWKAAYFNESVTIRTKCLILFDWIKSRLFGRDTSRI
ncbi:external alternative NAD(P)H-ubiquinone oxidoreductase B1, mitochondrial-like [Dendronephthya gigantea]|uniref:external alternative NAD(P)H-ubiquinone oxidoreductase B1, mitochondrial-like n=1 Tax=Dendronephthya gigantea TaxID=151771 RepID=UPI00106CB74E|nr:external alternative NAD(P)H-ubiquinone oxidoreductase B1, mitochondrial-like [Dendronephthya gigantea]